MAMWRSMGAIMGICILVLCFELSGFWAREEMLDKLPECLTLNVTEREQEEHEQESKPLASKKPIELQIRAGAECGSEGFKVDHKDDQISPWANGSIPFPERIHLSEFEPYNKFFRLWNGILCFIRGTNFNMSTKYSMCKCKNGYHGIDCGVPSPVWYSIGFRNILPYLKIRNTARRVVHGLPLNHELNMTVARLNELSDSISVYLMSESDFTAAGERKERYIDKKSREDPDFLSPFRSKIIILRMDHFPPEGCSDGWVADTYIRTFIGKEGLPRLSGLLPDDLFLLNDGDEIPRREVVDFLRLYDGYGDIIGMKLRWFLYGFFWETGGDRQTKIEVGCTIRVLRELYDDDPANIRRRSWQNNLKFSHKVKAYERQIGRKLQEINIGHIDHPAGYHCSWCSGTIKGIQIKLVSAQLADGPRWGNYPEKLVPEYLECLVKNGEWFDGGRGTVAQDLMKTLLKGKDETKNLVPLYMVKHFDEYFTILVHPSKWKNSTIMDEYRRVIADMLPN